MGGNLPGPVGRTPAGHGDHGNFGTEGQFMKPASIQLLFLAACSCLAGAAAAQSAMQLQDVLTSAVIAPNGSLNIGDRAEQSFFRTLRINNPGSSTLTVTTAQIQTPSNCTPLITNAGTFPRTVAPGATNVLVGLSVDIQSPGAFSFDMVFESDAASNPIQTISIVGNGLAVPDIRVRWSGGAVGNAQQIGSNWLPGADNPMLIEIDNFGIPGSPNLTFAPSNALQVSNTTNCSVTLPPNPTASLAVNQSIVLTLEVSPVSVGAFGFLLSIFTNDPDENPWSCQFNGTGTNEPIIRVTSNAAGGGPMVSGNTYTGTTLNVGQASSPGGIVQNLGTQPLILSTAPPIVFSLLVNCTVVLTTTPAGTIGPGSHSVWIASVTAPAAGAYSFTMQIDSNDSVTPSFTATIQGTAVDQPDIELRSQTNLVISHNGNFSLPNAAPALPQSYVFSVRNGGSADLNLTGTPTVFLLNLVNCAAALTVAPAAIISPSAMSQFTIEVTPAAAGPISLRMEIPSNDPTTPNYTVFLNGTATSQPVIELRNADGTALHAHNGSHAVIGAEFGITLPVSYRIYNTGVAGLSLNGSPQVAFSQELNCSVSLDTAPDPNVAPGQFTTFVVLVTAQAVGSFSFQMAIDSNDAATPSYSSTANGTATTPKPVIELRDGAGAVVLPHNGSQTLPGPIAATGISVDYRVYNTGSADLSLTGSPVVSFTNAVNCTALLTTSPASTVAPGAFTSFTILVVPGSAGAFSIDVSVESNDTATPTYLVSVGGTATDTQPGGGKKKGGGDDDGGCTANGGSSWVALLALIGAFGIAIRTRRV